MRGGKRVTALVLRRNQRLVVHALHILEQHAILRAGGASQAGLDRAQVQFDHAREDWVWRGIGAVKTLRFHVRFDDLNFILQASGALHVAHRFAVHREETHRRAVLRGHVGNRRAVRQGHAAQSRAEELHEFTDDVRLAQHLRDDQRQIGRGAALGHRAGDLEADDLWRQHVQRLPEHHGFGFDAADAPTDDAQPVDHRRVAVRADQRIWEQDGAVVFNDAHYAFGQILEVDLMDDAAGGWHDAEVRQRLLTPTQKLVALRVALKLEFRVFG